MRPLATAAVEAPGKSAVQSACAGSILSGKPVSRDRPTCSGPRQFSQPEIPAAGAARFGKERKENVQASPKALIESFIIRSRPKSTPTDREKTAPVPATIIQHGKDCNRIIPIRIILDTAHFCHG